MPVLTDPNSLVDAAKCLCFDKLSAEAVELYLLAVQAGVSTDPTELVRLAKCFTCLTKSQHEIIQAYLTCQIANNAGA